tara:strand:- start:667 stop:987 length:321 start_codon:yes stop_codon:yes gene_type:complete
LTDLRRGGGGDEAFFLGVALPGLLIPGLLKPGLRGAGALFFGGLTLSAFLEASLFPVFADTAERSYLRTALAGALFFAGACARLVAAATPGSKLGSLVRAGALFFA